MESWTHTWACVAAVLVLSSRTAVANDAHPPRDLAVPNAETQAQIAHAIRDLGSDSFAVREQATRKLIDLGIVAGDALAAAAGDADAEVRTRARAALATVRETDFRDRVEAFSADYDGSRKKTLPGWEQFASRLGSSAPVRKLFVEMQRAEPELFEALVRGGKPASEALESRSRGVVVQAIQAPADGPLSLATLASLLFVASADGVTVDEQTAVQLMPWLLSQPAFQNSARSGDRSAMLKQLLGMWVVKNPSPTIAAENLKYAVMFDLKPESLKLATWVLADEQAAISSRPWAILAVGRFGGLEHVSTIEKLLDDARSCGAAQASNPPRQVELQVRDIALAVLVHLTGQNLRDYGYLSAKPHPMTLFEMGTLIFVQPGVRDAALKKWGRWRAQHPD